MKKLYLYIRLSDADDDLKFKTESESIANQRTLLYRFIRARREFDGYEVVEFIDDGYSGTNGNRPSFERMIESLKNGEANVVICKDFSRFFRDYVEIGDYLERIFPFLGVRFIAVNDGYNSDDYKGSTAGMEVVMKYIVYSYYSRDLSQKIKTVMSTRKSKGEFVASQAPYGYMKDPDVKRKIIPNPDTAPVVRKIFDLALEGKTPAEIAVVLNDYKLETPSAYFMRMNPDSKKFRTASQEACWTSNNMREILKRREYTGVMVKEGSGRMAIIQNGSSLFTGDAGSGASEIRRYVIEGDLVEAIIQLPTDLFYNTGISTYIWLLTKGKAVHRSGKVQLIDASKCFVKRRKNIGSKRVDLDDDCIDLILRAYEDFAAETYETGSLVVESKVFDNTFFGFTKVTVETAQTDADGNLILKKGKKQPVKDATDTEIIPSPKTETHI